MSATGQTREYWIAAEERRWNIVPTHRDQRRAPVMMHPHGIFYANEMDGAYKGKWTDPGGFVQRNRTFTYVWECREGTEGTWLYHDHGPMDPLPVFRGLHGPLVIRKPGEPRPNREFFLAFHTFHLHGHRWAEADGTIATTRPSAPPTPSGGSSSPRTTPAAGSTTATSSSTCTRG